MLQESLALCGRMIKPPALKLRSTGADEAGTHKAWFATLKRAEYSSDFSFQNSKIFEGNTVIVKTYCKYFLSCTLGVGLCYWLFFACSGGYSKLGARGKDFQNLMFSKKNMALISYFPFFSQNHGDLYTFCYFSYKSW